MPNSLFIKPMPAGYTLSAGTKKLIAARDKALKALQDYQLENADYAPVPGPHGARIPAISKAEVELRKLDKEAVKNGKPLTSRDEFLAPYRSKAEGYKRTVAAMQAAYAEAFRAAEDAIIAEMPSLASKALEECSQVHKDWSAAVEAARDAEARMTAAVNRLLWAATDSRMNRSAGEGWADYADTEALEFTADGRLTRGAAQAIGLETYQEGSVVAYAELVDWGGAAPVHPRSDEVATAIGNSPEDDVRAEAVYNIAALSSEDYSRHFDG
ncbi:hypothetical protein [Streptomyces sp. NPDC059861]|uniref:hypothetical protein n=1 Tax=Streptomyces sp. NPDC059861 TaxID=3346974 RepID=UPI0036678068